MKKALQTILIVMMSLLALVSCSQEKVISDQLVSATLVSTDRVSKALETEVDFDLSAVKLWKYTARKANGGLTTGQTELGEDKAATLSSDGTTAGLSQGAWNFVLYGYDATTGGNLIAQGSINNATVTTTYHVVTITVNPLQTSGATGKIVISNDIAIVSSDSKTTYKTGTQGYTMNYKVYKSSDTTMSNPETNLDSLAVGSYKVVVTFTGTVNGESYTAATGNKVVNVYAGLTTTVKGTIKETEQAASIKNEAGVYYGVKNDTVTSTAVTNGLTIATNVSPVGTTANTSVTIPAAIISSSEGAMLELTVLATEVETESSNFTIVSDTEESPVLGALDITLKVNNEEKTDFATNPLTITTTIAKGLNGGVDYDSSATQDGASCSITVKYNGQGESGTVTKYVATSGEITFTVSHLSTYYIVDSNAVAYNSTTGTAYATLEDAVKAADTTEGNSVIELLCDASGNGLMTDDGDNSNTKQKSITIDFNNHTYTVTGKAVGSSGTKTQALHWGDKTVGYVTLKNGKIVVDEKVESSGTRGVEMAMQNYVNFTAEDMQFDFTKIPVLKYGENKGIYSNQERALWGNNYNGTLYLKKCTVTINSDSQYGICECGNGTTLEDSTIDAVCMTENDEGYPTPYIITKGTTTISKNEGKVISYLNLTTFSTKTIETGVTKYTHTGKASKTTE